MRKGAARDALENTITAETLRAQRKRRDDFMLGPQMISK
jgi:hypothetical protein